MPHIAYAPEGRFMHANKTRGSWTPIQLALTPFGGLTTCLALSPDGYPHMFYSLNGFQHQWYDGGAWRQETVEVQQPGILDRQCEATFDRQGRVHLVWAVVTSGSVGEIKYAVRNASGWMIERIDTGGRGSQWASIAVDLDGHPHILYYGDVYGQVRYGVRLDNGTWAIESVDDVGYLSREGRGGGIALIGDTPVAAYASGLGSTTLFLATKDMGVWRREVIPDVATYLMHPSFMVQPNGTACLAYEWASAVDVSRVIWNQDLVYNCRDLSGWVRDVVFDGYIDIPSGRIEVAVNPSLVSDFCGNPHLAFWLASASDPGVKYTTKGAPCQHNRPPTASAGGPYTGYEGSPLTFAATATDPDNDPLTYRWDFDNDGTADTSWSSSPTAANTWSDDYTGEVRVEVSDGNLTSNATATVTILNLPPRIDSITASVKATATLRIAGEKWHDVSAYLADGGNETLLANLVRESGKPQETSFEISIDVTRSDSLRIAYSPDDDKVNGQPNGATPAWLTLTFDSGPPIEMHHTFNVRHPETWNWTVCLNSMMAGRDIAFTATATDPGSDDLTFTWEWGDGTPATATTYFNDGIGPDPYPSPGGTFPFTATDSQVHQYSSAGGFDLRLTVRDDDCSATTISMTTL